MFAYIIKRLLLMIPTLLGILLITFAVIQFVPGGPVEQFLAESKTKVGATGESVYRGGKGVNEQRLAEIKAQFGFDKPAPERFWIMLKSYAKFDLGNSFFQHKPVWELVKEKLPVSITLGMWSFFLSYLISIPLGIAKAVRAGTKFDMATTVLVLIGFAIPDFVMGLVLLVIFGGQLQWFPLRGLTSANWDTLSWFGQVTDYLWHIALPVTASVIGSFATLTILTKNSFLEEIRKQYVITARAKGLSEKVVLWKHVFRNAMLIIVAGFPAAFIASFFGSSLLIETLFSLDGLGLLGYESVIRRDYPVILGTLFIFALLTLVIRLVSDLMMVLVDPRVKFD
jgi:microcin C transport system permease protein